MGKRPDKDSRSHGDPWLELIRFTIPDPGRLEIFRFPVCREFKE